MRGSPGARVVQAVCVLVSIVGSSTLFAQTADRCTAVLAPSVGKTIASINIATFATDIKKWACKQPNRSANMSVDSSGSAGLPIEGIPVQFGGTLNGKNASAWFDSNCNASSEPLSTPQAQRIAANLVPPAVVDAWKDCRIHEVENQTSPRRVKISGALSGGDNTVTLTLQWIPDPTSPAAPVVSELVGFNANCSDLPKRGSLLQGSITVECKRRGRSMMVFFLNTETEGSSNVLSF